MSPELDRESGERGLAEQSAHLGVEVRRRLDAELRAEAEDLRAFGGEAVDEHGTLAWEVTDDRAELADRARRDARRVDLQTHLAARGDRLERVDLLRDELRLAFLVVD